MASRAAVLALLSLLAAAPPLAAGLPTSPSWSGFAPQPGSGYGAAVSTAGDINGDGYSDLLIGAPDYTDFNAREGAAYVYLGGPLGLAPGPSWTFASTFKRARAGAAVSTAGDVNGDGYDDVLVGAPDYADDPESAPHLGRAWLFLGGPSGLATTPAWTRSGPHPNANLGASVAAAGDVNADGYADVLVGVPGWTNGEGAEGQVRLYLGSPAGLDTIPAWTYESDQAGARLGESVSGAGDLNADGRDDVAVGAPYGQVTAGQTEEGFALLFLAQPIGFVAPSPLLTRAGGQLGAHYGASVSRAGDVDGDGYADVAIGAPDFDAPPQIDCGRVEIVPGGAGGFGAPILRPDLVLESGARAGLAVATAGDVNGDGLADVVAGTPYYTGAVIPHHGIGRVWRGSRAFASLVFPVEANVNPQSPAAEDHFSYSVATAGDVNGDGFSDVAFGRPGNGGRVDVYDGGGDLPPEDPQWEAGGAVANDYFGMGVCSPGDVDGDGFDDLLVSNGFNVPGVPGAGSRAYLHRGSPEGPAVVPDWTILAGQDEAIASAAPAGDVNADGYDDVLVCSPFWNEAGLNFAGRARLFLGSPGGLATTASWTVVSDQDTSFLGFIPSSRRGDVNGDGFADVLIGTYNYTNGQPYEGRVQLFYGSPTGLSTTPGWTAERDTFQMRFGLTVSHVGDIDRDGYGDFAVGALLPNSGIVYLFRGGPSGPSSSPSWMASSPVGSPGIRFGRCISSADVNGDGYSDLLVGDNRGNRAYAWYGSAAGLAHTPSWTQPPPGGFSVYGFDVAGLGDVNGDGYDDVLVTGLDNSPSKPKIAHLFLGSATGLGSTPAWSDSIPATFTATFPEGLLGALGDLDGDGFADLGYSHAVSDSNAALQNTGHVRIFLSDGGGGRDRVPQPRASHLAWPIARLGRSNQSDRFALVARGRTPAGRGKIRLRVEAEALGTDFDGLGTFVGPLTATAAPAGGTGSFVPLSRLVTGLTAVTPYRWRARLESPSPFFPRSIWMTAQGDGVDETDFRTPALGTGVPIAERPTRLELAPPWPNPGGGEVGVAFALPERGPVRLSVIDVAGRRVATLVEAVLEAGPHEARWSPRPGRTAAGLYFLRLEAAGETRVRKLVRER